VPREGARAHCHTAVRAGAGGLDCQSPRAPAPTGWLDCESSGSADSAGARPESEPLLDWQSDRAVPEACPDDWESNQSGTKRQVSRGC
jgi:hypothetical protein